MPDKQPLHEPYWNSDSACPLYPTLDRDQIVDVLVVGAGITGLSTALHLLQAGRRVGLVEMHRVGSGTTGHSTGHLDATRDETMKMVVDKFGEEAARLVVRAGMEAIDLVERWHAAYGMEHEFVRVPGYLYAEDREGVEEVHQEYETALKLGLDAELVSSAILTFPTRAAVRFPRQARFQPYAYVCSLARAFVEGGGMLYEETRLKEIEETEVCRAITDRGVITAQQVVLATHSPLMGLVSLQTRAHPFQSYVISARVELPPEDGLYWDTADPYHYTRIASSADPGLLIIGGADHHTGEDINTSDHFAQLEVYARERYRVTRVEHHWSHEFFEPADGLPFIGRLPGREHTYIATGLSGDGLKFGTVAGMLLAGHLLGQAHPLLEVFAPERVKGITALPRLVSDLSTAARHWVGDRLKSGDVEGLEEIAPGEGAIVFVDGERLAVYRDETGHYHAFSPVCRHAGGIVHWNAAEKTWDCPVHGGRYDAHGVVIVPPPKENLKHRDLEARSTAE